MAEYLIIQASSKMLPHTPNVIVKKLWGLTITYCHCICNRKQTTIREVRLLLKAKEKKHNKIYNIVLVIVVINVYLYIGIL